jgi:hypothetical protein
VKRLLFVFVLPLFYLSLSNRDVRRASGQSLQTSPSAAEAKPPLHVTFREALQHRLGDRDATTSAQSGDAPWFVFVRVEVIVAPDGSVTSATAKSGPKELFEQAVGIAKAWKYQPFERDGQPQTVQFIDTVSIPRPERRSASPVPFPEIRDWNSLIITLDRTGCFGSCSAYHVEIHGDGTVIFSSSAYIAVPGEHRYQISHDTLVDLVGEFRAADYFSLLSMYRAMVTDNPTFTTSIAFDQSKKQVIDYAGAYAGMPAAVTHLERAIDRAANSEKWIKGGPATVSGLLAEGWSFKSHDPAH